MAALYKEQLGELIAARRDALGLTQSELADLAHVKESTTVSRWERGERAPNDLEAVAAALQTTAGELLAQLAPVTQADRKRMAVEGESQLDRIERKLEELLALTRPADGARPSTPDRQRPPLETTAKKRAVRAKARTQKAADAPTGTGR